MTKTTNLSRRHVVMGIAISPILAPETIKAEISSADVELINLGRKFDEVAAQIDHAISDPARDVTDELLDRLRRVEAEILVMQSQTVEGLRVKARAACWALLGDLDPSSGSTTDKRMALSVVRDLIRLYDSNLEHPGAHRKLVAEVEQRASDSA